jgi:tRNA dimethylallyltransferase
MQEVTIIFGPTASGKTDYAIKYAKKNGGEIINCDSLQVYKDLKILTAHPSADEMSVVKHRLFGYLDYDQKITSVDWAKSAASEIQTILQAGMLPIMVGGTGLYINTLINGISPLPKISGETRENSSFIAKNDYGFLCEKVYENDPRIRDFIPQDRHRQMTRAFEILAETGKSILHFYRLPRVTFLHDTSYKFIILKTDRIALYEKINRRFDLMLELGAVDEVKDLMLKINASTLAETLTFPIFQAIGSKEIAMHIREEYTFEQMKNLVTMKMRNYAKRQITWLKHKIPSGSSITAESH